MGSATMTPTSYDKGLEDSTFLIAQFWYLFCSDQIWMDHIHNYMGPAFYFNKNALVPWNGTLIHLCLNHLCYLHECWLPSAFKNHQGASNHRLNTPDLKHTLWASALRKWHAQGIAEEAQLRTSSWVNCLVSHLAILDSDGFWGLLKSSSHHGFSIFHIYAWILLLLFTNKCLF